MLGAPPPISHRKDPSVRFLFILIASIIAWEGACELARLQRWHAEDAAYWRRKIAYQTEEQAEWEP